MYETHINQRYPNSIYECLGHVAKTRRRTPSTSMAKTHLAVCDFNSLRCVATAKIPLTLNPQSMPSQSRVVMGNMLNEFVTERDNTQKLIELNKKEYTVVYGIYNSFVLRKGFIEDKEEFYESLNSCVIGIDTAYDSLSTELSETCEWFSYFEYLKFNVHVRASVLRNMILAPHAIYIAAKGILALLPPEPSSPMPVHFYVFNRECREYAQILRQLVTRYDLMFSYQTSMDKQNEYAMYLDQYDIEKDRIYSRLASLKKAIEVCSRYMYPMFEGMSLDDILGF